MTTRRSSSLDFLNSSREVSWANDSWISNTGQETPAVEPQSPDGDQRHQGEKGHANYNMDPEHNRRLKHSARGVETGTLPSDTNARTQPLRVHRSEIRKRGRRRSRIYDDPAVVAGYASVPLLTLDRLPRGGLSLETKAVGRIQFGIPPETIKDSMQLGIGVPSIYIVPAERFCREIGPALGINLAEFEFPAYFNYFMRRKRCTLVVDSLDAESQIRKVFEETLLGPAKFRNHNSQKPNDDEDFDPSFPREKRPNFYKEFYHFRTAEEASHFQELDIDMLLQFSRFKASTQSRQGNRSAHDKLGVPPVPPQDWDVDQEETSNSRRRSACTLSLVDTNKRHSGMAHKKSPVPEHIRKGSGNISLDFVNEEGDEESDDQPQGIRRTFSDPNIKRLSMDSTVQFSVVSSEGSPVPDQKLTTRRGSMESMTSFMSRGGRSRDGMSWTDGASFMLASDEEDDPSRNTWMYSQAKWLGEVATVYPADATDEQKDNNETRRVEIFKMTGGTEYIVHDIDENNIIIGKARFSGTVRVPDEMAVEGFLSTDNVDAFLAKDTTDDDSEHDIDIEGTMKDQANTNFPLEYAIEKDFDLSIPHPVNPPTFHPPSFGVTVLGNSHGFDKNGSVSGYVLWLNGRGVMIDPPPYSSATLEREGIRPQMIIAIIITHCHADHDAGTFQKVMTGSRVSIVTTPTIYKSFIRKYAALSGLNPTLLCHSHRHRPAIVGQPLRFQGAVFHFTYTLHTIPCIAFKVKWRGRSMVFTGDHLNNPCVIGSLENKGVLSRERAEDLRRLPLQDCDVLLHEAGAPPIHTPLHVLEALPEFVKSRLYVVHTAALPDYCELRVAPTGTAGTIRIDQFSKNSGSVRSRRDDARDHNHVEEPRRERTSKGEWKSLLSKDSPFESSRLRPKTASWGQLDPACLDDGGYPNLTVTGDFVSPVMPKSTRRPSSDGDQPSQVPPLVFLRPPCVSDGWFILNLLSAVPFLSSLSYSSTMDILEIAYIKMFCAGEVVIPASRTSEILCVVWEGTCMEREGSGQDKLDVAESAIHGDLTNSNDSEPMYDDAADGLFRRLNPTVWHAGDWMGPVALQPEAERSSEVSVGGTQKDIVAVSDNGVKVIMLNMLDLNKILKSGSKLFRKYLALKEKQAAEEAAMREHMMRNEALLRTSLGLSNTVENGYAEDHIPSHWNAYDSVLEVIKCNSVLGKLTALQKRHLESFAEGPRFFEAGQCLWQAGEPVDFAFLIVTGTASFSSRTEGQRLLNRRATTGFMNSASPQGDNRGLVGVQRIQEDKQLFNVSPGSEYARLEVGLQLRVEEMELDVFEQPSSLLPKEERMRNARDRFANKVLARLYSRRAFTAGLIFSRGHFLSDTSRMVSGSLAHIRHFSRREERNERSGNHHCHTSNIVAGYGGCAVMVFPRSSLIQFLDGNPGVLLSLLGTFCVV